MHAPSTATRQASNHASVPSPQEPSIMTLAASQRPVKIDTANMLGYCCSPRAVAYLWDLASADTSSTRCRFAIIYAMRIIGVVSANASFYAFGGESGPTVGLVWLSLATLPTAVMYFALLNRSLLRRLLVEWEAIYVLGNVLILIVSLAIEFGDIRVVALVCVTPSFLLIALTDALPPGNNIRKTASLSFYSINLLFLLSVWFQLYLNLGVTESFNVTFTDNVAVSALSTARRVCITLILFGAKNLVMRILYPDCLVVLKSRIATRMDADGEHSFVSLTLAEEVGGSSAEWAPSLARSRPTAAAPAATSSGDVV